PPPPHPPPFPYTTLFRSTSWVRSFSSSSLVDVHWPSTRTRMPGTSIAAASRTAMVASLRGGESEVAPGRGGDERLRIGMTRTDEDRKSTRLNSSHVAISY